MERVIVVGIDPGKDGALVAIAADGSIERTVLAKEQWVSGGQWLPAQVMRSLVDLDVSMVVVEKQQARPMQGRSSVLQTGYGWGILVGVCAGLGIRCQEVTARKWQRQMHAGFSAEMQPKQRSCAASARLLPMLDLTPGRRTKPHDGLADAGLLALYGHRVLKGEG